jgi:glycosyltransferase involved in cell wall biosynthesis
MRRQSLLKNVAYSKIERKNLSNALFLHATSASEAETLAGCNLGVDVKLLPNGVEIDGGNGSAQGGFRGNLGLRDNAALVVSLGRLHPIKRLDLLADAFSRVVAKRPETHLVIAGPDEGGYRAEVEPRFSHVASNVHWIGKIEGEEKRALLADADVFVSCSDSESFGMSIAEAMLARAPVVVTRTCPWSEVVTHNCGFWVEQDASAIAVGINQILESPAPARAMGERGRELILSKYSWGRIAMAMVDSYRAAIRRSAERS